MHRDVYALIDTFGACVIGLTLSTILVHAVFLDSDKFFTKVQRVQTKNFYIMIGQLALGLIILLVRLLTVKDKLGELLPEGNVQEAPQHEEQQPRQRGPSVCAKLV